MQSKLAAINLQRQAEEQKLTEALKERDRLLWAGIEATIKAEEEKVRAKLEAERKRKEEEEQRRKAEEEKRRQEEERKRQEAERKLKEELERKKQQEMEQQQQRQAEKLKAVREQEEAQGRQVLGLTSPLEDWAHARESLKVRDLLHVMNMPHILYTEIESWPDEDRKGR